MKKLIVLLAIMMPGAMTAQFPEHKPDPELMKLKFMTGEWVGSGWIRFPGMPKVPLKSKESVSLQAGGNALSVAGYHTTLNPSTGKQVPVHDAFAVITWTGEHYRFNASLATGNHGDYKGRFDDGKFIWGYENQWQGKVRYTIGLNDKGQWQEIGEASRDGNIWTQFFELTLNKKL